MATKLGLYNAALIEIGSQTLSTVTDAVESRRVLDEVYDNVLSDCLLAGQWNFAIRTVKLDADTSITPNFGPPEVFAKPSDWLRTIAVSDDERFSAPLLNFFDEGSNWVAETTPIYISYISNDASYGLLLSAWPRDFTRFVELSLADRICEKLTQNKGKKDDLERDVRKAKNNALSHDAMNEATPKYLPPGSWTTTRRGGRGWHRGNRGSLIG